MVKKNSMFYILLFINLCSITLLSAFNYFVFHNMNSKAFMEGFVDYNRRVTNLAFRNIDKQLMESVMDIPRFYFTDVKPNENVLLPQDKFISSSPEDVTFLIENLKEIHKAYPYVLSMDVYYKGTRTIVTGFDKVHYPRNDEEVQLYLPWHSEFEKLGADQYFFGLSYAAYPLKKPVLTYVKRIKDTKWKGGGILVAFHISPDRFWEYLNETKGALILADHDQRILFQSGSEESARVVLEDLNTIYAKEREKEPDLPVRMKLDGESVMVFSNTFPLTGLEYVYYMPEHAFLSDYNVKSQIFLMNFGLSVLFNILMLAGITWLNYAMYRKRIFIFSKAAGIAIGDDTKSFDGSLTALTGTITDLSQTVKSSEAVMEQNALRSLILNRNPGGEAYKTMFGGCTLSKVCCFIAYLKDPEGETLFMQAVRHELDNRKTEPGKVYFTTLEKGQVVAVAVYDGEDRQQVQSLVLDVMQQSADVKSFVSGVACDLNREELPVSFKSASEAARYRFIYTEEQRLSWEELEIPERKSHGSHLKMFAAIEKDINSGDFLEFKYHMEALRISFQKGHYTIDYCLSTIRDLVTLLYQIIQRYQLDMWVVYGYDIREYYKQLADIDSFCQWAVQVCEVLLTNLRQKKTPESTDLKSRLEQMIEEHLEKDISLDYLSDSLSIRRDVLSRTFRQLMGKSYTDYVKEKKMSRALELIEEDCSIKEIADRLGYSTPQYFIKIFKESFGVTPYQYKKKK